MQYVMLVHKGLGCRIRLIFRSCNYPPPPPPPGYNLGIKIFQRYGIESDVFVM